jgi:ribonuclease-3
MSADSTLLGYHFTDPALLRLALTHPHADQLGANYQRLEFLGDRVVGLSAAQLLYRQFPEEVEGALAKRHAWLVSRPVLAQIAVAHGLRERLIAGLGERQALAAQASVMANVLEAAIGAIFLDGGWGVADSLTQELLLPLLQAQPLVPQDAKSALQEWAQARGLPPPLYALVDRDGPSHAPIFVMEVALQDHPSIRATAPSKRLAEQAAAQQLLDWLQNPTLDNPQSLSP